MNPDFQIDFHFDPKQKQLTFNIDVTARFDGEKWPPNLAVISMLRVYSFGLESK